MEVKPTTSSLTRRSTAELSGTPPLTYITCGWWSDSAESTAGGIKLAARGHSPRDAIPLHSGDSSLPVKPLRVSLPPRPALLQPLPNLPQS